MAKQRYINTKIWEDNWFASLDQIEQLVFIYFLTNPMTNIIGAYELSKGTISRSTGLETKTLEEILQRFEKSEKVYYVNGWVIIPNFIKHQNFKSPTIQKGIELELKNVPDEVKKYIKIPSEIPHIYGIDTLSHLNTNTNTNNNKNNADKSAFLSLKAYFFLKVEELKGYKPQFDGGDGSTLKKALAKYGEDKAREIIAFYLQSPRTKEAVTLKAAFSTYGLNSFFQNQVKN